MPTDPIRRRSALGGAALSERDLSCLRWIGEQYACRMDHIQLLIGRSGSGRPLSATTARRVAWSWVHEGLARTRAIIKGDPAWVWLTRGGLRAAGLSFRGWEPTPWSLEHLAGCNRVRLLVEKRHPGAVWTSDRELRSMPQENRPHIPDAEVLLPDRLNVAIEVEITPKNPSRRDAIMEDLAARYDSVWYFASGRVWAGLHDALCAVPPDLQDVVRIYALEEV